MFWHILGANVSNTGWMGVVKIVVVLVSLKSAKRCMIAIGFHEGTLRIASQEIPRVLATEHYTPSRPKLSQKSLFKTIF